MLQKENIPKLKLMLKIDTSARINYIINSNIENIVYSIIYQQINQPLIDSINKQQQQQ